jgi:hypothetical protein
MVQSRSWVITGFQALAGSTNIKITGNINLPNVSGLNLGLGEIITYSNMDDTNIYLNGSRIDYINTAFALNIPATPAFNVDPDTTMYETLPLRVNYIGSFRILFQLPSNFQPLNVGSMLLRLSQYSVLSISGGFAYDPSKKVCEFMDISTG